MLTYDQPRFSSVGFDVGARRLARAHTPMAEVHVHMQPLQERRMPWWIAQVQKARSLQWWLSCVESCHVGLRFVLCCALLSCNCNVLRYTAQVLYLIWFV